MPGVRSWLSSSTNLEIPLDLYVIRHADALALGERGITSDQDRPLSAKGETQSAAVGKMLQRRGIVLEKLVASPYLRAQQTAQIVLQQLKPAPELLTTDALEPDAKPRKLAKYLQSLTAKSVGLVGHLPHVGVWTGWLIGSKKSQVDFAKAGVAHLVCSESPAKGEGGLHWLVTPEWFS